MTRNHNEVTRQVTPARLKQPKPAVQSRRLPLLAVAIFLAPVLLVLACGLFGTGSRSAANRTVVKAHLPTLTRTPLPTLTPTSNSTPPALAVAMEEIGDGPALAATPVGAAAPLPSEPADGISNTVPDSPPASAAVDSPPLYSPTATATERPTPTSSPTAIATELPTPTSTPTAAPPTSTPLPEGWVFANVRTSTDHDRGILLLYGDLINNTGLTQDLAFMTGTFYDDQGQMMPDRPKFVSWPIETVSQGGRVPFELTVIDMDRANNFDLKVEARPSDDILREDFVFMDLNPSYETGSYCVLGRLRNPGDTLQDHLKVVAVLYDDQDKVLNFNDYYKYYPQEVVGDQTMDFEVCVDPFNQEVSRYELRAWGL